ncbi:polyol transporter 5-like [Mangifera indica]|uniref:polyol transporter 5-like n=1 Tax=Mangifera indica TaxID=29780 RepID=UPI001CFAC2C2|nr:polyol transporter 5-like [Mangifera indica]
MSGAVLYIKDNMKIDSAKVEIFVGSLNVCSLIGSLLSEKTSDFWDHCFSAVVPSVIIAARVIIMLEFPGWLVVKDRIDQAKAVLMKTSHSHESELRLAEIVKAHEESKKNNTKGVWKGILRPTPAVHRMLVGAIGINFFMQASGNDAVIYYTPHGFKDAGIHNMKSLFRVNVIMGLSKTIFVFISPVFLDRFGWRPLLFIGTTGVAMSLAVLRAASKVIENYMSRAQVGSRDKALGNYK